MIEIEEKTKLTHSQLQHVFAFAQCVAAADKHIRDHGEFDEVGLIIAEDVTNMRGFLKKAVNVHREYPVVMRSDHLLLREDEKALGYRLQEGEYRVERIRKNALFVEKEDDLMVQLADACAFAFRRYFSEFDFGDQFIEAMLGAPPLLANYRGPCSSQIFWDPTRKI
jgi:hypothetical protein